MKHPFFRLSLAVFVILACGSALAGDKFNWSAVSAEDLALKEVPGHPGLSAVILDRDTYNDDMEDMIRHTVRLKILTEQGRDHANIEIPYWKEWQQISDLRARLIKPDGTVVPFTGQVYEKLLGKKDDVQLLAKTFSFPDVQVGSIIEYHYEIKQEEQYQWAGRNTIVHYHNNVEWLVGDDLFVRHLRYTCRPGAGYAMTWFRLAQKPVEARGKLITLEMTNVAPFLKEEYAPPVKELKPRVDILYGRFTTVDDFWKEVAKNSADSLREFIGENRGGVRRVVDQTIQASDSPEDKLRKLYARVQQIRNLSYEPEREWKQMEKEHVEKPTKMFYVEQSGRIIRNVLRRTFRFFPTGAPARTSGEEASDHLLDP